jgi:hypothetical protein
MERESDTPPERAAGEQAASEEEVRARLEEEVRKLRVQDVLLQSVASLINLSARRIAKEDERDLEQARLGIDAVRAVVDLLDPEPRSQIQNAVSELQMLYAKHAGEGAPPSGAKEEPEPPTEPAEGPSGRQGPSRLWTPPGTTGS